MKKLWLIIISVCFLTVSCDSWKHIEYRDREVIKYVIEERHDTLIEHTHDSIFHTIIQKGDTIYNTKYIEKVRYRDRVVERVDTCWQTSLQVEYKEKIVEVKKVPTLYKISLLFTVLFIIFALYKLIRWLKTR